MHIGQKVACAGLYYATHSEYVSVPRNLVTLLPENISLKEASFVTLGAIALQGVRLADIQIGETVLIFGLGLVGMVAAQIAEANGAQVIGIDIDTSKVEFAKKLGINSYVMEGAWKDQILSETRGFGVDKTLLCASTKSHAPVETAPDLMRQKGILVVVGDVGMNIPRRAYFDKEIDIKVSRSYGPGRYDMSYEEGGIDYPYGYVRWTENRNMQTIISLIAAKKIHFSSLISHEFSIEDASKAYSIISGEIQERFFGIVLKYPYEKQFEAPSLPIAINSKPPNSSQEVQLGIIGAGDFGKAILLPAFSKNSDIQFSGVCTASGVSAKNVANKYRIPLIASDPEELFCNDSVNSILIASRHDSHADYVIEALKNKKNVFVEKPLAMNIEQLDKIKLAYEENSGFLQVGYNRRFSKLSREFKKHFQASSGPLSIIYRVNAGKVEQNQWTKDKKQGGGRVIGEVCHFIDYLIFLTSSTPSYISAQQAHENKKPISDNITITIQFENGSIGTIHYFSNGSPSMPKEYIEAFRGGLSGQLINFKKMKIYDGKLGKSRRLFNQDKGFVEEARSFSNGIKENQMPIPFEDLYMTSVSKTSSNTPKSTS